MIRSKIASRFKRAKTTGFLWALLALVLHVVPGAVVPAHAQGSRKDDIVFNSRGIPLAGATVRVCAMPASGQPCTPLALIYSDSALTQALANPTTTDGLGNYFFYAAPGKYEIEISGPGITTKQIPNVFLPNDPSSPAFSAVSAFSLNLSGNLTVNGSTTVIGNLASGTLNLSNQSTPPGAAGSGTVNLYTKTTDKRLYYKDDAGVESGPLGAGAQTNVANNWTAQQNFNANQRFKGPNPYVDVTAYGVRAVNPNTTPATTGLTANCTNASASVSISAASSFVNGDGVVLYGCGAPHSMTTPGAPTVTPSLAEAHAGAGLVVNDASGATTYNYQIIARDAAGGLTAASVVGSTTTGASSLGAQTYTITSATVSNQVVTVTTSASHNLPVGCTNPCNIMTSIAGTSDDGHFGGWQMIDTVPSSTTFTYSTNPDTRNGAPTSFTGGTGTYWRANHLTWSAVTGAWEYYIYGRTGSSLTLIYVSRPQGPSVTDLTFDDFGSPMMDGAALPAYVPNTPPAAAASDNLVSTISSGAGTTTLTLANAAGTTVTGATIRFDNAPNILAAANASTTSGGTLFFPVPTAAGTSFVTNSYLTLPSGLKVMQIGTITLNETLQLGSNTTWRGDIFDQSNGAPQFGFQSGAAISVNTANPGIFLPNGNSSAFYGLQLSALASNASVLWITDASGNQTTWKDITFTSGSGNGDYMSSGLIMRGISGVADPFELYYDRVNFLTGNGVGMPAFYCHFCGQNTFYSVQLAHRGLFFYGDANVGMLSDIRQGYAQGINMPFASAAASSNVGGGFQIANIIEDTAAVPTFSFLGPSANPPSLTFRGVSGSSSGMAAISGRPLASFNAYNQYFANPTFQNTATLAIGSAYDGLFFPGVAGNYASQQVNAAIAAGVAYPVFINGAPPALTNPCTVSSGGSLSVGAHNFTIVPIWANGAEGVYSPKSTCTTTTGNQTITLNWTQIPGNPQSIRIYDGGGRISATAAGSATSITLSSETFSGNTAGTIPAGGPTMMMPGTQGIATPALTFAGSSVSPPASGFTATRNISFPDNSGIIPVTSYQNSAYDNATRANGAIGSNWTVTNNGINIASNNFVGTVSSANDVAYWSVNTFSAAQFSQVTLTALNGTTDFPGAAVLLSGSGGATHGYNCVEDTTNIFIQKITGGSNTTLTSAATTGAPGDILRLEVDSAGNLTCYKNGVSTLTVNDTTYTSGSPGLFLFGTVATSKNWGGGNLRPLAQLDSEQDWTKTQHFTQGIALGGAASESFNNNPRAQQNVFLPGALTSTWTGATWTTDKAITITRVQVQAKTAPTGCTTNAAVRLTDGTTPVNVTISAAANDSGVIAQNYAAGSSLTVAMQTAAASCTTSPADANVTVQYRMQ